MRRADLSRPFVFISYARANRMYAHALREALELHSIPTFMDVDLRTGSWWRNALKRRLQNASVVLVLWSHEAFASGHVIWEAGFVWQDDEKNAKKALDPETFAGRYMPLTIDNVKPETDGVQPFSERNYTPFQNWNRQYDDECFVELVTDIHARLYPGENEPDTEPHDELASEYEASFIRLLNRESLLKETDQILRDSPGDSVPILLVEGFSSDWIRAFADHLMVRQTNGDYSALERGDPRAFRAIDVPVAGSCDYYRDSLLRKLTRSDEIRGDAISDWCCLSQKLNVVYTVLNMEADERQLAGCIRQVRALSHELPKEILQKQGLIFVFGCLRNTFDVSAKADYGAGVHWLSRPGEISLPDIDTWHQRLPGWFGKKYKPYRVYQKLECHLPEGKSKRYKKLEGPLLDALEYARIPFNGVTK